MNTKRNLKELLNRRVDQILPNKNDFEKVIKTKKIRVYLGIDPTNTRLHLGHTIALKKLQEFADFGQEAILIIGTGTVLTGDPSQRAKARKKISRQEVKENIKTWKRQAGKILDFSKVKVRYNGEWLLKLKLEDIINIASNISAIKLFQRDMFQRRIKQGETVWTHEALYPLLQGYDSVALDVDLEIGGTDQIFNMLIGRELQKKMNNREKFVLTTPMILGIDGQQMSKTSQNCVWIEDSAKDMYGKIMSMPDNAMFEYFELLTEVPLSEIEKLKKDKTNPRDVKAMLAREIVTFYYGSKKAIDTEEEFKKVFEQGNLPKDIAEIKIKEKELSLLDLLVKIKLVSSKTKAKQLVLQGGVKIENEVQKDWQKIIKIKKGTIVQVGKRNFAKLC
ncbi:MAG: tyrosine--tRNA ligase [Patescibacteria group bacterium]|nr:tyrosine--tRNA ligase [Patescibacteria group bacterium]